MEKSPRYIYHGCCSWVSSFWGIPPTLQRWQFLRIWNHIRRYHEVSASIARVWQILCSEYPFYHGIYWQTDRPSTLRHRITSNDWYLYWTGTVYRLFWKGSQKANCFSVYANDWLLVRPLSDKASASSRELQPTHSATRPTHALC
jgi:hypothetical protein